MLVDEATVRGERVPGSNSYSPQIEYRVWLRFKRSWFQSTKRYRNFETASAAARRYYTKEGGDG